MLKKSKKKSKSLTSRSRSKNKSIQKALKPTRYKKKFSFKQLLCEMLLLAIGLGITFSIYIILTLPDINSEKAISRQAKITILADNGYKLAEFGDKYNTAVLFSEIPTPLIDALIKIEDKRFYSHIGIDVIAIARAIITNIQTGKKSTGASTITQQLAKNLFLSSEKSYMRKIREFFMAFYLEYNLSKEQILTIYLNRAYFGSGNYGISSAADFYYGKSVSDLNIYESVSLVAVLKSPLGYNPIINPKKSKQRTIYLLNKLYDSEDLKKIQFTPPRKKDSNFAGYFNNWIFSQTLDILGEIDQDVWVTTTLDPKVQATTESNANLQEKDLEIAVIVNDYNGAIKAMIGGKDYTVSQFNRATQANRQQGSLLKPFAYLFAMEHGYPLSYTIYDEKLTIQGWSPKNYSKRYYGEITLHDALVKSLNTVPVALINNIGIDKFQNYLGKFGLNADCSSSAVVVLGVCANTLLDLSGAYTTLASGGYAVYPYGITSIKNKEGEVLYSRTIRDKKMIIDPDDLNELNYALADVISHGTGKNAYVEGMNIKGKTGTTQHYNDALFIGFDKGFVTSVWIGKDNNTPMKNITGGSIPAEIFKLIMQNL